MATHRATSPLAVRIARRLDAASSPKTWTIEIIRDACDIATGGEFPPGELDKLATMVRRRLCSPADLTDEEFAFARKKAAEELASFEPAERVSLFEGILDDA